MAKPVIHVAVGLLIRPDGFVLLGSRPHDKPWPGWWELPGGKIEANETPLQALKRELNEELGITVKEATPWVRYSHDYPKTHVHLNFFRVRKWEGEPQGLEGQQLAWVAPDKPGEGAGQILPATEPPLRWLQLPERYIVSAIGHLGKLPSFLERLKQAHSKNPCLLQFREPNWTNTQALREAFLAVLKTCREHKIACLVNSQHPESWWTEADGVHLRSHDAQRLAQQNQLLPNLRYVGASAHNLDEIETAKQLNTSFVVLGHVKETPSHPKQIPLGWSRFTELAQAAQRPVFAIGGQSERTLLKAQQHGAHGIAGIRNLLPQ